MGMGRKEPAPGQSATSDAVLHIPVSPVLHFADRLEKMQATLKQRAQDARTDFTYMPLEHVELLEARYAQLASFAGRLAKMARQYDVEVSETDAVFGKKPEVNQRLKGDLAKGMDQQLMDEIGGNYHDGDTASLMKQVGAFTGKLRAAYHLPERGQPGRNDGRSF